MKVYELNFESPKEDGGDIFKAFYFEPANIYENRRGRLFMAGQVGGEAISGVSLLKHTSDFVKEEFYGPSSSDSSKALRRGLKRSNDFLRKKAEMGEIEWLSSFNFAVLSLTPEQVSSEKEPEKYELNFTKVGNMEIILLRAGETVNLGERVKKTEIEPYPLTVFSNIVSGQLLRGDRVLVLSNKIYEIFLRKNYLKKIAGFNVIDEGQIKRTLKGLGQEETAGVCLFIDLGLEDGAKKNLLFRKKKDSRLKRIRKRFKPAKKFKSALASSKEKLDKINIPLLSTIFKPIFSNFKSFFTKLEFPFPLSKMKLPSFARVSIFRKREWGLKKRHLLTIFFLLLLIFAGRIVSQLEEKRKERETENKLEVIYEKEDRAQAFYQAGKEEEARKLYLELWGEFLNISKSGDLLLTRIEDDKARIREDIREVNKLKDLGQLEPFLKFKGSEFLPQRFTVLGGKLFFSTPYSSEFVEVGENKELLAREVDAKVVGSAPLKDKGKVLFLTDGGRVLIFGEEAEGFKKIVDEQRADSLSSFSTFRSNLYFWQKEENQVLRLPYLGELNWGEPEFWLKEPFLEKGEVKSMAVDGGIWVLRGNKLFYFYKGESLRELSPTLFPEIKRLEKIFTSEGEENIYISESTQRRIIVLDKESGELIAQFESPQFNNIKDIKISGRFLYVLSNTEVYRVEL